MNGALRRLALAALLALSADCHADGTGVAPEGEAPEAEWSVWLLRHAEKADDGTRDPPLSAAGEARAAAIASRYAGAGIEMLWTTDYRRTRETLAPLASAAGITLETYDPRSPGALVARIRAQARNAMVVGHSNTVPDLTARLCGCEVAPMDEGEYGRVARVRFGRGGPTLETWFEDAGPAPATPAEKP